jgi:hypothetical protein
LLGGQAGDVFEIDIRVVFGGLASGYPANCLRSDSVHFLFLISSDVTLVSLARRDDADDFFAMLTLPVCVDYQRHDEDLGLNRCRPNRAYRTLYI